MAIDFSERPHITKELMENESELCRVDIGVVKVYYQYLEDVKQHQSKGLSEECKVSYELEKLIRKSGIKLRPNKFETIGHEQDDAAHHQGEKRDLSGQTDVEEQRPQKKQKQDPKQN